MSLTPTPSPRPTPTPSMINRANLLDSNESALLINVWGGR
jgi:hypothetical protein